MEGGNAEQSKVQVGATAFPKPMMMGFSGRGRFRDRRDRMADRDLGDRIVDPMNPSFDGKRMRRAIHRKTVDYNPSMIHYLENRVFQRDRRDRRVIQPDACYAPQIMPPIALLDKPMNCVTTKFVRTSTNKFRCPIFCLAWTPEGRRLVTGASSGEFTLWNGLTFNFETILQAHDVSVRAMRWSHNDQWMVTADHAGYIKYWQSNMNNVKMYQGHKEPVRGVRLAPFSTTITLAAPASASWPLAGRVPGGDNLEGLLYVCCLLARVECIRSERNKVVKLKEYHKSILIILCTLLYYLLAITRNAKIL